MSILRNDAIKKLIETKKLIEVPEGEEIPEEHIQPASYDLRLGDEYIQDARKKKLRKGEMLTIPPYDFVVVSTHEKLNMPSDVAARFQNRMRWAFNGLNMSMGAQVDPGYKGKLYCTLFNCTNKDISIEYLDHLATIEFIKTTRPTRDSKDYSGPWKDIDNIADLYTQGIFPKSGFKEILAKNKEMEGRMDRLEGRIDNFYRYLIGVVAVLITLWGILEYLVPNLLKLLHIG